MNVLPNGTCPTIEIHGYGLVPPVVSRICVSQDLDSSPLIERPEREWKT